VQSPATGSEGTTRVLPKAAAAGAVGVAAGAAGAAGRRRKRSPWPWIALVVFLVIAAVAGALIWHTFFGSTTLSVPSVVGQAQAAAVSQLQGAGFAAKVHDDYSDQFGLGLVTRQQPTAADKLVKGGTVDIWVSRGAATITLIDFSNWTPAAVASWLTRNNLIGKELTGASATVAKGKVFAQSPAPGTTVNHGATVSYRVSRGLPQVSVPDLSGLDQNQAAATLHAHGLQVGTVTQQTSSVVPVGQVAGQNPSAGTLVASGASVAIAISTGTPSPTPTPSSTSSPTGTPTPVAVPNVETMTQTAAEQLLSNDGFVVVVKKGTSTLGSGYVYDQSPKTGDSAAPGSTVTIWVTQ
jgi:beta-lactam-binding protein with PASTA domain